MPRGGECLINQSEASPSVGASAGWALSSRSPPLIPSRGSAKEQRCERFREGRGEKRAEPAGPTQNIADRGHNFISTLLGQLCEVICRSGGSGERGGGHFNCAQAFRIVNGAAGGGAPFTHFQGPLLKVYPSDLFHSERGLCVYEMGANNGSRFESKVGRFFSCL